LDRVEIPSLADIPGIEEFTSKKITRRPLPDPDIRIAEVTKGPLKSGCKRRMKIAA